MITLDSVMINYEFYRKHTRAYVSVADIAGALKVKHDELKAFLDKNADKFNQEKDEKNERNRGQALIGEFWYFKPKPGLLDEWYSGQIAARAEKLSRNADFETDADLVAKALQVYGYSGNSVSMARECVSIFYMPENETTFRILRYAAISKNMEVFQVEDLISKLPIASGKLNVLENLLVHQENTTLNRLENLDIVSRRWMETKPQGYTGAWTSTYWVLDRQNLSAKIDAAEAAKAQADSGTTVYTDLTEDAWKRAHST